jgi:hypothetical protein
VRGALSATLTARECGLKVIAEPERNAAVVECVDVFALKSLPKPSIRSTHRNRFSRFA